MRVYGYDSIPSTLPTGATQVGRNSETQIRNMALRSLLLGMGAYEAVTYSFISPKSYDRLNLPQNAPERMSAQLLNPLGEDYSVMRTTLVPSMLQTLSTNISRSNPGAPFFEIGTRFLPKALPLTELPEERPALCVGIYGDDADFYALKGIVETLASRFGLSMLKFARADVPYLHPGRSADGWAGDSLLARMGQVHPDVAENFDIHREVYVAEIDLAVLDALTTGVGDAQAMPRFPSVARDFALVVKEECPVGDLMDAMAKAAGSLCEKTELFDIYRGTPIRHGEKSVAIALTLRATDHTLAEEEITRVCQSVLKVVETDFDAVLRS